MDEKKEFMQIRYYAEPLGDGTDKQKITIKAYGMNGIPCEEGTALLKYAEKCTNTLNQMAIDRSEDEIKPLRDELNIFLAKQEG